MIFRTNPENHVHMRFNFHSEIIRRLKRILWMSLPLIFVVLNACSSSSPRNPGDNSQQQTAFSFYYLASQQIENGELDVALSNLDSAIIRRPNYANFYQVKGWVLEQLDSLDNAVTAYEKCLSVNKNSPEVQLRLGKLYLRRKNYERAAFHLRKSALAMPDSHAVLHDLSEAYIRMDRSALALDQLHLYEKKSGPSTAIHYKLRGMALYYEDKFREAEQDLVRFVAQVTDDPEGWKFLGMARFAQKMFDQSISDLNRAGNLDPSDGDIYLYRSRYFVERNKPDIAMEQLSIGVERDPHNVSLLFELGRSSFERREFDSSKKYLQDVVTIDPEHWESYKYLGLLAEAEGHEASAENYFRRYLDNIYEEDRDIRNRLEKIVSSPQQQ